MYAARLDFHGSPRFIGLIAAPTRTLPGRTRTARARRGVGTSAEALERRMLLAADFGPAQEISQTGDLTHPFTALAADFDRDGDLDIVAFSRDTRIAWYPNLGNGSFGPARTITSDVGVSVGPANLAVGDVNGDGRTDLVSAFYEYPGSNAEWLSKVAWYEYNPAADTWTEHVVSDQTLVGLIPVRIADLDRDGDADIVSSNYRFEGTVRVVWFENDADVWKAHVINASEEIAEGSVMLEVGDTNGDGWLDVVVGARFSGTLVVYRNPKNPQDATDYWLQRSSTIRCTTRPVSRSPI